MPPAACQERRPRLVAHHQRRARPQGWPLIATPAPVTCLGSLLRPSSLSPEGRAQAEQEAGRAPVTHSSSWRPSPVSPSARARNCRTRSSARCTTGAGPAASSSRSPWPPRRQAAGRAGDAPTMRNLAFGSLGRAAAVRTLPSSAGRRRESGVQHDAHPCTQRHCPRQRAGPHCQPHPRIRSQNGHALGAGYSPGATQTRSARASQLDAAQRRGPHRLCRAGCDQGRLLLGRQALPDRFCGVQLTRGPHARVHQPARARRHGLACRGARRSGRRAPRRYQYRRPIQTQPCARMHTACAKARGGAGRPAQQCRTALSAGRPCRAAMRHAAPAEAHLRRRPWA